MHESLIEKTENADSIVKKSTQTIQTVVIELQNKERIVIIVQEIFKIFVFSLETVFVETEYQKREKHASTVLQMRGIVLVYVETGKQKVQKPAKTVLKMYDNAHEVVETK